MASKRAWEAYPSTYRAREMKILSSWIQAGESGSAIGLAGAGKSNLLGFLSHRPEMIVEQYLTDPFLSQSALREALFWFQEKEIRLALILDPFDQFCQDAPTQVLDNLRGLRDSFKNTLSYLTGLRKETIRHLRTRIEPNPAKPAYLITQRGAGYRFFPEGAPRG